MGKNIIVHKLDKKNYKIKIIKQVILIKLVPIVYIRIFLRRKYQKRLNKVQIIRNWVWYKEIIKLKYNHKNQIRPVKHLLKIAKKLMIY